MPEPALLDLLAEDVTQGGWDELTRAMGVDDGIGVPISCGCSGDPIGYNCYACDNQCD
jgi:hypothetical protein